MTKQQWGDLYGALAMAVSCTPALIAGCASAAAGEGFDKGFESVTDTAYKLGQGFGEEYGKTVAKTTVKVATIVVLGEIVDGLSHPKNDR